MRSRLSQSGSDQVGQARSARPGQSGRPGRGSVILRTGGRPAGSREPSVVYWTPVPLPCPDVRRRIRCRRPRLGSSGSCWVRDSQEDTVPAGDVNWRVAQHWPRPGWAKAGLGPAGRSRAGPGRPRPTSRVTPPIEDHAADVPGSGANSVIGLPRGPGRDHRPDPAWSLVTHLSQPPHPLPASPDPVGDFFPVGDLTANMVVNPPTGKKSPRSFSHRPGANPANPRRARKSGPVITPPKPCPVITLPTLRTVILRSTRLTSRNSRQPSSVIRLEAVTTELWWA